MVLDTSLTYTQGKEKRSSQHLGEVPLIMFGH